MRINYAREEGMKRGMEKGAAKERERSNARIARNNERFVAVMRANNVPEEQIQVCLQRDQDDNQE